MFIEKPQNNLLNIYTVYALLKQDSSKGRENGIIKVLGDCTGDLSISELSEKTGIKKEELINNYLNGEIETLRRGIDITALIIETSAFRTFFMRYVSRISSKLNQDTLSLSKIEADDFINDFLREKSSALTLPDHKSRQGIIGFLLNGILSIALEKSGNEPIDVKCNWLIKKIKASNYATQQQEPQSVSTRIDTRRFFELVEKFDNLQGKMKSKGQEVTLRSLIDVLAYLTSPSIHREREYVRETHSATSGNTQVYFNKSDSDNYYYKDKLPGSPIMKDSESGADFKEYLPDSYLKSGPYLNKENIFIVADYSGEDTTGVYDKASKKKTYHRLVDSILSRNHNTVLKFVHDTVNDANALTMSNKEKGSDSNTPLFNSSSGYCGEYPESNIEMEMLNRHFTYAELVVELKVSSGEVQELILNDSSIIKMLEISDFCSVVKDIQNQLAANGLSWYHLKPSYEEYLNRSLKKSGNFSSMSEQYRSLRFLKDKEKTYYYGAPSNNFDYPEIRFNTPKQIKRLEELIDFFKTPSLDTARTLLNTNLIIEESTPELYSSLVSVFGTVSRYNLVTLIRNLEETLKKLLSVQEDYTTYVTKVVPTTMLNKQYQRTYGLFFCMKYDEYVIELQSLVDKICRHNSPSLPPSMSSKSNIIATNLLTNISRTFIFPLNFCLEVSESISDSEEKVKISSIERQVQEEFNSPACEQLRKTLVLLSTMGFPSVEYDDKYIVDEYFLYHSRSTNELILEPSGKDENGSDYYKIANKYNINLFVKEKDGKWSIVRP